MAKSKNTQNQSILSPIIEGVKSNVIGTLNKMVQEKVKKLEKMGMEIATGFLFFAFGIFFLLMAIVFYFHEWMQWGYFGSFLAAGIVAMLACFVMAELVKKN